MKTGERGYARSERMYKKAEKIAGKGIPISYVAGVKGHNKVRTLIGDNGLLAHRNLAFGVDGPKTKDAVSRSKYKISITKATKKKKK